VRQQRPTSRRSFAFLVLLLCGVVIAVTDLPLWTFGIALAGYAAFVALAYRDQGRVERYDP
jgi:hypothetical protein